MAELRLSAAAREDLIDIRDQGVRDFGPAATARHLAGFEARFVLLRERPFAGQQRPEFELAIRSLSHRPHRILYQVDRRGVLIVRIIHQARDVRGALRERS